MTAQRRAHTRAFLFADLRGYSAFTERHGDDAAADLLGRYRHLVREQIAAFGGAEIRTEGDSFYVVFDSVGDAVDAALAIRDTARDADDGRGSPIRVGIGVHAGEARDGEQGIVSSAVNVAARVCAAAQPGEVLVTDTVRGLTRTALRVVYTPRGRRRLKGISEPIALFRVEATVGLAVGARRRGGPGLLIVAGVVVALVAVIGLAASRDGVGTPAMPTPSAGGLASPSASRQPDPTRDLSRFTDPGEFPNAAEQALLDLLLSRVAARCERADPADTPTFHFIPEDGIGRSTVPLFTRAGLDCLVDGVRVRYWQASGGRNTLVEHASDLLFNTARRLSLSEGDCAEESRVYGQWDVGTHAGMILCYVSADGAVIAWTFDEANIYATARVRDDDSAGLYRWWVDTGRLLGR